MEDRWSDKEMLHKWIHNNQQVIKDGYPYAVNLYNEYNKTPMNLFPTLSDKDIDDPCLCEISAGTRCGNSEHNAAATAPEETDNTLSAY